MARSTADTPHEKEPKVYQGHCLCGRVQFQVTGEPFHYVICSCKNCRQSSGSAFITGAMFKIPQLAFIQGEEDVKDYADSNTLSGRTMKRSFCSHCGGKLFLKPVGFDVMHVHPPAIEGSEIWVPKKESHPQDRLPWVKEITFLRKQKAKL